MYNIGNFPGQKVSLDFLLVKKTTNFVHKIVDGKLGCMIYTMQSSLPTTIYVQNLSFLVSQI
jgi:hypothetical protein